MVKHGTPRSTSAVNRMCLAAFLLDFSVMIGITVTPFFVFHQLGRGEAASGVFGGTQLLVYAATCLASSRFLVSPTNTLRLAVPGVVAFAAIYGVVPLFRAPALCLGLAAAAMAAVGLVWPALQAWLGGEPDPDRRAHHIARFNIATGFGFAISPLVTGPLYDFDYRLPFVLLGGFGAVIVLLLLSLSRDAADPGSRDCSAQRETDEGAELYLHASWVATTTAHMLVAVTWFVFPKRLELLLATEQLYILGDVSFPGALMMPATQYSWLAFTLSFTTAITFVVAARSRHWRYNLKLTFAIQVAAGTALLTLASTRSLPIMLFCFVVVGANQGLTFFSSMYYSVANSRLRHQRAAINEAAVGIGSFLGGTGSGIAVMYFGHRLTFEAIPVIVASTLILQWNLVMWRRKRFAIRNLGPENPVR